MIFMVSRMSKKRYDGKPCKAAFELAKSKLFGKKIWGIEFKTLEEFMNFRKAMGCPLVIYHKKHDAIPETEYEIVIHDKGYID